MSDSPLILATDCGGTKCAMLLVEPADGSVVRATWHRVGDLPVGKHPSQIFGGCGRSTEMLDYCLQDMITQLPNRPVMLISNMNSSVIQSKLQASGVTVTSAAGIAEAQCVLLAENLNWGMVLSAGTGFIGTVWMPDGTSTTIDASGPLIGDWGSAYFIGQTFLRRTYREQEYSRTPLPDMVAICRHLDTFRTTEGSFVTNYHALMGFGPLYNDRSVVASLSQVCEQCAREGSRLAHDVLVEAGEEIAISTIRTAKTCGLAELADAPIIASGSVLRHSDIVHAAWYSRTQEALPKAHLIRAKRPQICGQIISVLRTMNPTVIQAFFNHYDTSHSTN